MKPLVLIPNYMTAPNEVEVVGTCLASIRQTVSDTVDILIVDDGSPGKEHLAEMESQYGRYDFEVIRRPTNEGFSRTVNVGLEKARDEGREVILMNADMEMLTPGWLGRCQKTTGDNGEKAAMVGALLLFPNGLIQHAGIYFSLLTRTFDHLYRYAPGNLPEALEKKVVPVTGAFQYIRPETLEKIGIYDPKFRLGWEDVDYNIRVLKSGLQVVYNPNIRAYHYESLFRGRKSKKMAEWQAQSFFYLAEKYAEQSFAGLVPYW